jgi:thiol-disulfide isomerase/thioredoxin
MKQYILVALLVLLVACAPAQPMMEKKPVMQETSEQKAVEKQAMEESEWTPEQIEQMKKDEAMEKGSAPEGRMMEPGLIGGGISRYYNWDKAKFDQASKEGKTIYLEFSANWCPICQSQEPELIAGFAALDDPNVVGFKIHYKDDQSTPESQTLIEQYQIAYQHTKVIIKNGKIVKKNPESWTKDKFLETLRSL